MKQMVDVLMDRYVIRAVGMENVGCLYILYQREASAFARSTMPGNTRASERRTSNKVQILTLFFFTVFKAKEEGPEAPIYYMKKFLSLLCAAIIGFSNLAHAYDFEVDGIYYNILSEQDKTCEVTRQIGFKYDEGNIDIPSKVRLKDQEYKVTTISPYVFLSCDALTSVVLHENLISIDNGAFGLCKELSSVSFPNSLISIGKDAFTNCETLTSVIFPENSALELIGEMAFSWCSSLVTINFPKSITAIGQGAFVQCGQLTSIVLPNKLKTITHHTFFYCSALESITFPKSLISIEEWAFGNCKSLESIIFPDSLKYIGNHAFYECSSLSSISFPESLTAIGKSAFSYCRNINLIENLSKTPPIITEDVFESKVYENATLRVPDGCVDAYKAADVWKLFSKIEGGASSGIEDVAQDEGPVTVYTLGGVVVYTGLWNERPELPAGMYIVRNSDGISRKVAIR